MQFWVHIHNITLAAVDVNTTAMQIPMFDGVKKLIAKAYIILSFTIITLDKKRVKFYIKIFSNSIFTLQIINYKYILSD